MLSTAPELWTHIVEHGGLQPEGWDAPLADGLRVALDLGPGDMATELAAAGVTVERLVHELLGGLAPFATMMADLLALFARHAIQRSDGSAEIVFDFSRGGGPKLSFDLEAFRRQQGVWERATGPGLDADWIRANAWDLCRLLDDASSDREWNRSRPGIEQWYDDYWAGGTWPPPELSVPASGNAALDGQLGRAAAIWAAFVTAIRARARTREALRDALTPMRTDMTTATLAQVESDYWVLKTATALITATDPGVRTVGADDLADTLEDFLDARPFSGETTEQFVRRLFDILDLPLFGRRHELYAAWVFAELLAVAPAPVQIAPDDRGVLRFPFARTEMARLTGGACDVVVWSELRSPLTDPVGYGREASVQPDYSVLVGGADAADSVLEIECKQYRRANRKAFAAALEDYARARPGALVLLVSHGPLRREGVLAAVRQDVRDRTDAIAHLQPHAPASRERFRELVAHTLKPLFPPRQLTVRLEWDSLPGDLDLHLRVDHDDETHHVWYREPGDLDRHPFVALSPDVRHPGGAEEVTIAQLLDGARYEIAVHNFSDDGRLAGSSARVRFSDDRATLACPGEGTGRWWHVATIAVNENAIDLRAGDGLSDDWQ
jgi:hypothetical protein